MTGKTMHWDLYRDYMLDFLKEKRKLIWVKVSNIIRSSDLVFMEKNFPNGICVEEPNLLHDIFIRPLNDHDIKYIQNYSSSVNDRGITYFKVYLVVLHNMKIKAIGVEFRKYRREE
jgi:hypothetical protein